MNKKEILEIKKQYVYEKCPIQTIWGCYVDTNKEILAEYGKDFRSLPEEEIPKYLYFFRQMLGKKLGKNLSEVELGESSEMRTVLQAMKKGVGAEVYRTFCERIIREYTYNGNYLILVAQSVYDIPGKSIDNQEMFDASDEIYEHLICCICPVGLVNPGLTFDASEGIFKTAEYEWAMCDPMIGFVYPAFTDRSEDPDHILYYEAKPNEEDRFLKTVIKETRKKTPEEQKESLCLLIRGIFGDGCSFEEIKDIFEQIHEIESVEELAYTPSTLGAKEMEDILTKAGAEEEQMDTFGYLYDANVGKDEKLKIMNLGAEKLRIKGGYAKIEIDTEAAGRVSMKKDQQGNRVLEIMLSGEAEINGIPLK